MSDGEPKKRQRNLGASFQQKLRNQAKATGDDVSLMLTRYVNERFLYRLSASPYRDHLLMGERGSFKSLIARNDERQWCSETRRLS